MKPISKKASMVLDHLTRGLAVGEARKLDHAPGAFMALSVDRLTSTTYSCAHYYEQNGDLCPDPDMVFWRAETGAWLPVSFQDSFGYRRALELGADGQPAKVAPRTLRDLVSFTGTWMENIRQQQGIAIGGGGQVVML